MVTVSQRLAIFFCLTFLAAAFPVEAATVPVTVTIISVTNGPAGTGAGDFFDGPDFYARIFIPGPPFVTPTVMNSASLGVSTPMPAGWSFTQMIPSVQSGGMMRVAIELWDSDWGQDDQQVDINPLPPPPPPPPCDVNVGCASALGPVLDDNGIAVDVNLQTGSWVSLVPGGISGSNGTTVCSTGDRAPAATICFSISVGAPVPITVSKTTDSNGPACIPGLCSLREAVNFADSGDTILLPASPAPYDLSLRAWPIPDDPKREIGGHLQIRQALLIIKGPTAGGTAVIRQTQGNSRVFDIHPGAELRLDHVTVTSGEAGDNSTAFPSHIHGGGIHNHGKVRLSYVTITGNRATDEDGHETFIGGGGGIFNGGEAFLSNVTIANNVSVFGHNPTPTMPGASDDIPLGGGIAGPGPYHLHNTVIANNVVETATTSRFSNCGRGTAMSLINEGGNLQFPGDDCGVDFTREPRFDKFGNMSRPPIKASVPLLGTTTTAPLLMPLHSGLFIFMPAPGGPAVDGGVDRVVVDGTEVPACGPTDQAGNTAPFGAHCDVGAVEHH